LKPLGATGRAKVSATASHWSGLSAPRRAEMKIVVAEIIADLRGKLGREPWPDEIDAEIEARFAEENARYDALLRAKYADMMMTALMFRDEVQEPKKRKRRQ
jgi:hypothetical protein